MRLVFIRANVFWKTYRHHWDGVRRSEGSAVSFRGNFKPFGLPTVDYYYGDTINSVIKETSFLLYLHIN
jgi:hypothetical protein